MIAPLVSGTLVSFALTALGFALLGLGFWTWHLRTHARAVQQVAG